MPHRSPRTTTRRSIAYFATPTLALSLALTGCGTDSTDHPVVEQEPSVEQEQVEPDAPDVEPDSDTADPEPVAEPELEDRVTLPDNFPDDIPLWSGMLSLVQHQQDAQAEYWQVSIHAADGEADLQSARELLTDAGFEELSWTDEDSAATRGTFVNDRHEIDFGLMSAPDGRYIQYWVVTEF